MWYAALIGGFIQVIGTFVGRALISAGVGFVVYRGMDVSIGWAKTQFFTAAGGLPPVALQVLALMKVDVAVNMLFSALLMRLSFKGMTAGVMKAARFQ